MKIAFFSTGIPDPSQGGSGIFNYLVPEHLLDRGHQVKAFLRVNERFLSEHCDLKYLPELSRKGFVYEFIREEEAPHRLKFGWSFVLQNHHYAVCKKTIQRVREELEKYDGIISLDLGWALALANIKKPKICFLGDSLVHRLQFQGGDSFLSPRSYLRFLRRVSLWRTKDHLKESFQDARERLTIIASFSPQYVKELTASSIPSRHFRFFTPVVSFSSLRPPLTEKLVILHVGSLYTTSSQNMVHDLMDELFPLLSKLPMELEIRFVGRIPEQFTSRWKNIHFVFLGHLDSLEEEFKNAHVFLSAMKYPVGVRTRIISALSYGIPVIANPAAALGLPELAVDRDILYGDTPQDIFEIFQKILSGDIDLKDMGEAARKAWEEHYNPEKNIPFLHSALNLL